MELCEAISKRRSIRQYKDDEISNEIILDIINKGILAPSAKNRQPWKFYILKNEKKQKVVDIMREKLGDNRSVKFAGYYTTTKVIEAVSVLILVYRELRESKLDSYDDDLLSIGACIENMVLTATDLGIGSLWIGYTKYAEEEIGRELGINNMQLITSLALGMANEEPLMRPRKNIEDCIVKFDNLKNI